MEFEKYWFKFVFAAESGRVRVAVRLRPKNTEDLSDADFSDCIELQPEVTMIFNLNECHFLLFYIQWTVTYMVIKTVCNILFHYVWSMPSVNSILGLLEPCMIAFLLQLKRLKLKKNNWSSEAYRFDEVFTESTSQMRVYEAVAKPVVEVSENCLVFAKLIMLDIYLQLFGIMCMIVTYINTLSTAFL